MKIEKGASVHLRLTVKDASGQSAHPSLGEMEAPFERRFICGRQASGIPGLDVVLTGLTAGFNGEITIPCAMAYGDHRPELVFEAVRENLPEGVELTPGMPLYTHSDHGQFQLRVLELTERGAILDGNHPLAGQDLVARIQVLEVRRPSAEEEAEAQRSVHP